MNRNLAQQVLDQLKIIGVEDICICPAGRNAPFVTLLQKNNKFNCFYWYEERSAAFFALGKAKSKELPAATIVTSGTAAGELLPAVMEAYYSCIPLLLITADRPKRFRGTGAPQTAEQVNLFGMYTPYTWDLAHNDSCDLRNWNQLMPAHINICFEEPLI